MANHAYPLDQVQVPSPDQLLISPVRRCERGDFLLLLSKNAQPEWLHWAAIKIRQGDYAMKTKTLIPFLALIFGLTWGLAAVIIVWLNRHTMFKRGTGTTEVLMPEQSSDLAPEPAEMGIDSIPTIVG
jgi:hypothetical protein